MNGTDATWVWLGMAAVLPLAFCIRDGIIAWWLIRTAIGRSPSTSPAVAAPAPAGSQPAVASGDAAAALRFTDITATSFAGAADSTSSRTSAYGGGIISGDTQLGAALPYHFPGTPPTIRVQYNGKSAIVPIRDVGPWNTNDPYWTRPAPSRPQAETGRDASGRKTNLAGLDLTPATWKALGYTGDANNAKAKVSWDFTAAQPAPATPGAAPPWLVLVRKLRDINVHATHDSAIIMSWPALIAQKYPEMAEYCKGYVHDTTPWCGLTVAAALAATGVRPQFGAGDTDKFLWAASWLQFGTAVQGAPQPGDILIFQWSGGGHHVTLYDHAVEGDASYHCTGGNQGDSHSVTTEAMSMKNCIGVRRPASAS